jgi:hypothetical protein
VACLNVQSQHSLGESAEYKAGIRLYTKPATGISGDAVHPANCCLLFEANVPLTEITGKRLCSLCSWRAWPHRETVFCCFLFAFHCCISTPLLDSRPCEFPLPPPPLLSIEDSPSRSFYTSCTDTALLHYRGSVTQEMCFCRLPG